MIRSLLRLRLCFSREGEETKPAALLDGKAAQSDSLLCLDVGTFQWNDTINNCSLMVHPPKYKTVSSHRSCILLKLIWNREWTHVLDRLDKHPEEAYCLTQPFHRTALHLASFNHGCPLVVVEALLKANLHALYKEDNTMFTPLHYACYFQNGTDHLIPLFCRVFQSQPASCRRTPDTNGSSRSPLLLACDRDAPIFLLNSLLDASQTISSKQNTILDNNLDNHLSWIAPVTGAEPYWWSKTMNFCLRSQSPLASLVDLHDNDITQFGKREPSILRVFLDLKSTCQQVLDQGGEKEDCAGLACLQKVYLLIQHCKHQLKQAGYEGSLLHIVSSLNVSIPALSILFGTLEPDQATTHDSLGYIPLHHVLINPNSPLQLLTNVLAINPAACSIPTSQGIYPIFLAIQHGWEWETCVSKIVKASPQSLCRVDRGTGLTPFLMAASLHSDTTNIFELLRAAPHNLGSWQVP